MLGNLGLLRKRVGDNLEALRLVDGAIEGAERGKVLTQRLLRSAADPKKYHAARRDRNAARLKLETLELFFEQEANKPERLW